jgi:hypothetical protein
VSRVCGGGCLALLARGAERIPRLVSISKPYGWYRMRPQEVQQENEPVMSNDFSARNSIVLKGDRLLIGGAEYSLHDVKGVRVSVHIPTRFWRWALVAVGIMLSISVLEMGIILLIAFLPSNLATANSLHWTWVVPVIFFGGVALSFGTFIYGWRTYPGECRVELDTSTDTRTVYVSQSFIDAQAFRDRLQRKLTSATRF